MSTHTPGPWVVIDDYVVRAQERSICICPSGATAADPVEAASQSRANAALIAAAPDLLAALKQMVTWMPSGFAPQSQSIAMKMAYDAIAKAEGTS